MGWTRSPAQDPPKPLYHAVCPGNERGTDNPFGLPPAASPCPICLYKAESVYRPVDPVPRVPPGRVVPMACRCTIYLGQGRQRSWRFCVNLSVASSLVSWPPAFLSVEVSARRLLTLRMPWAPQGDQT